MKTQCFSALSLLAATPSLALGKGHTDEEAAASSYHDHIERLRTRNILEAREVVCHEVDCMDGGDADCLDVGCNVCAYDYYCTTMDDKNVLPKPEEMLIIAGASDITGLPRVLTNFLEAGQLKNQWAKHICKEITKVPSDQDFEAGVWHYSIQGTHKRVMSLTHDGEYLTMLVTWEPSEIRLLPMFDSMKMELCTKAIEKAAVNTHTLEYGAFDSKSVAAIKNRHAVSISTPGSKRGAGKTKRGRSGNTVAFINIELGDHNKEVGLFNGNGMP